MDAAPAQPTRCFQVILSLFMPCHMTPPHYEIWKYCQSTGRLQAEVPQNLRVPLDMMTWVHHVLSHETQEWGDG